MKQEVGLMPYINQAKRGYMYLMIGLTMALLVTGIAAANHLDNQRQIIYQLEQINNNLQTVPYD